VGRYQGGVPVDLFGSGVSRLRWKEADILLGTSGYSFTDWKGNFYPEKISSSRMLEFYAGHFDSVEINSTYYGIMPRKTTAWMVDRTPDGFTFTVKLHSSMTHDRNAGSNDWKNFFRMLEPFRRENRLGALLAQFPYSFQAGRENLEYIDRIRKVCVDLPLAVEFRHDSWYADDVMNNLSSSGVNMVSVDLPGLDHLPDGRPLPGSDFGYIRFHGRNREQWYSNSQLRYDYLYSERELRSWFPAIKKLSEQTGKIFMFFNNCHMGKAVMSAGFMRSLLEGDE